VIRTSQHSMWESKRGTMDWTQRRGGEGGVGGISYGWTHDNAMRAEMPYIVEDH